MSVSIGRQVALLESIKLNTMLLKLTLALATLLGLSVLGLWYQYDRNTVLDGQNKILIEAQNRAIEREQATRKVLVARQAAMAAKTRELAEAQQGLKRALQANKTWSDTDVPTDVQEALGGPSGGLPDGL